MCVVRSAAPQVVFLEQDTCLLILGGDGSRHAVMESSGRAGRFCLSVRHKEPHGTYIHMYVRTYLHTVTTPPSCVCTYVSPPAILTALRTSTPACPAYNAVICHGVYRLTGLRSLLVFARADPILETFADSSESIEMWTYLTEVCDQDVGGWMVHEVAFYTDANCSMRIRSSRRR